MALKSINTIYATCVVLLFKWFWPNQIHSQNRPFLAILPYLLTPLQNVQKWQEPMSRSMQTLFLVTAFS